MKSYIESGELAPDSIVIGMIRNYINEHKDATGNIFDGFPRTTAQAEEFDRILAEEGDAVNVMVYMDVPEEELVKRILLRGKESGRADDASGGYHPQPYRRLPRPDSRRSRPLQPSGKV